MLDVVLTIKHQSVFVLKILFLLLLFDMFNTEPIERDVLFKVYLGMEDLFSFVLWRALLASELHSEVDQLTPVGVVISTSLKNVS